MSDSKTPDRMKPVEIPASGRRDSAPILRKGDSKRTNLAFQRRHIRSRKKRLTAIVFILLFGVFALATTVGVFKLVQDKRERDNKLTTSAALQTKEDPIPTTNTDLIDMLPAPQREKPFFNATVDQPNRQTKPDEKYTGSAGDSGEIDNSKENAVDVVQLQRLLKEVKDAIGSRDFKSSRKLIVEASRLAGTSSYLQQVERWDMLADYVGQFWDAFEDGISNVEGSEIVIEGERMFVVECNDEEIIIRGLGENVPYNRNTLSSKFILFFADRGFNQASPSTKVFKGAFMFVSPDFGNKQVRTMWQEAAADGIDVTKLMPLLDD